VRQLVSTDVRLLLLHLVLTQAVDLIGGKLLHDVLALLLGTLLLALRLLGVRRRRARPRVARLAHSV